MVPATPAAQWNVLKGGVWMDLSCLKSPSVVFKSNEWWYENQLVYM